MAFESTRDLLDHLLSGGTLEPADVDQISEELEEDLLLDFKSGEITKNKKKASSEVRECASAFSNSEGGVLIVGVADQKPRKADGCKRIGGSTLAEWAGRILASQAHLLVPPPRIFEVKHDKGIVLVLAFYRTWTCPGSVDG